MTPTSSRSDIYSRITDKIVADLEQGVRPWLRPWNADHAAGRITRPLRHNGIPYNGINVIMLWSASVIKGYSCPLWLTFKQALELGGNVRRGETGELVVYADRIKRTEIDARGEECEREIPFLKGYTVFNAEQCEGSSRTSGVMPRSAHRNALSQWLAEPRRERGSRKGRHLGGPTLAPVTARVTSARAARAEELAGSEHAGSYPNFRAPHGARWRQNVKPASASKVTDASRPPRGAV
jgi:hypothetical protein